LKSLNEKYGNLYNKKYYFLRKFNLNIELLNFFKKNILSKYGISSFILLKIKNFSNNTDQLKSQIIRVINIFILNIFKFFSFCQKFLSVVNI
jgi:hypothetical protein